MTNPVYYISSGAKNAMYTLRKILHGRPGAYNDQYVAKLSRDWPTAVLKARKIVEEEGGLIANLNHDEFDLAEWGDKLNRPLKQWEQEQIRALCNGIMPFGKYAGVRLYDLPEDYVKYWLFGRGAKRLTTNPKPVYIELQRVLEMTGNHRNWIQKWEHEAKAEREMEAEKLKTMSFVGEVGQRQEFFLRCDKRLQFDTAYGTQFMCICADKNGNEIVLKTYSSPWEVGKYYVCDATVKSHKWYKDVRKQTIIQRPRVKKVIEKDAA